MDGTSVRRHQRGARADHPAADVGREAFAGAAQMGRVHARQIVPPEAELRDRQQPREEDARLLDQREAGGWNEGEDERQQNQSRHLEQVEQAAPADNDGREDGEEDPPGEPAELLKRLDAADRLLLRRAVERLHFRQPGDDARHLLNRAERRRVGARHHDRRHDRRPAELRLEERAKARALERARRFFSAQTGDSGRNGRMMISGIAGMTPDINV